jgi:hypothetical protein
MLLLLGFGLVVTAVIQGALFMASNPDPFRPVPIQEISKESEVAALRDRVAGAYIEASGEADFGLEFKEDGTYTLFETTVSQGKVTDKTPFESGAYGFAKSGNITVILLEDQTVVEILPEGLDFYGYTLTAQPELAQP